MTDNLIPLIEAAKRISLGEGALRRRLKDGTVAGQKLGRDWHITAEALAQLEREFPLN